MKENSAEIRFVYWQDAPFWLGYLEEFPDYLTQGRSFEELEENLSDLFRELTSGTLPNVRRVGRLQIA